MAIIDKIERQINSLAIDEVVPFSYVTLQDISKDTIRKYLVSICVWFFKKRF